MSTTRVRSQQSAGTSTDLLVAAVLVALPLALGYWLVPAARNLDRAALTHELLVYPFVLAAGVLLYVCWRIARDATTAWLAAGATLLGVQGIGLAAVRVARPTALAEHSGWSASIDLLLQGLLVVLTALAARRVLILDPFVLGTAAGVAIVAARVSVLAVPPMGLDETALRGLAALVLSAQVCTAALLVRLPGLPMWLRARVGGAVILLGLSHFAVSSGPVSAVGNRLAVLGSMLGASLVLATSFALLKMLLDGHGSTIVGLNHLVEHLEADARLDLARRHEIGATIAGIANASHLLQSRTTLPEERRRSLEQMVDSEAARLQRLMEHRLVVELDESDLDAILHPLVIAHRTRGRVVHWQPSGIQVLCRPDDIAEVVNILLENAAQHGGTDAYLTARRTSEAIEIRVFDHGPGIAPTLADAVFQWGHRGTQSTGQGIGLHIAHRLMTEQGGNLDLAGDVIGSGATFIATLPHRSTDRAVAHEGEGAGS